MTSGIGLEELGIKMNRAFVEIDACMQTSIKNIYAIGDITGKDVYKRQPHNSVPERLPLQTARAYRRSSGSQRIRQDLSLQERLSLIHI